MVRAVETEQGGQGESEGARGTDLLHLRALRRSARPRQWSKNLLVFAAPGAAGVLSHGHGALRATATFGVFCLVSSGTYLVNDALDAPSDRQHPTKRLRPVAAGELSIAAAAVLGAVAQAGAVGLAWWLAGWRLALVVGLVLLPAIAGYAPAPIAPLPSGMWQPWQMFLNRSSPLCCGKVPM